jgi:SAM-dependent methyltransferase
MQMQAGLPTSSSARELLEKNRSFYDLLWSDASLVEPQRFNTWPLIETLSSAASCRLEVAPGLRPRLPIRGTQFADISAPALAKLQALGGEVVQALISELPFASRSFDLVCALDIIEHVEDDHGALAEIARVAKPGATLLLSAPLHQRLWTPFDDFVGHKRRYEPADLFAKLAAHGIEIERTAVYGMQPRSSRLVDWGMWWLVHHRERAMWWYNRVFMKIALRTQKKLQFNAGIMPTEQVDEIFMVCRRVAPQASRD